jgi:glycosyltransferase involved in cell wall biosynthesis
MSDPAPLVSIIIPAYNQARYLRQSVESALAQTYTPFEVIVVDDGSTDETAAIAASYGERISLIRQENRGLAGARNTGIRAARGEWVGLLDADDIWLPEYLAQVMALAAAHPQADVFYCRARSMDSAGNDLQQVFGSKAYEPDQLYCTILHANFIIPSTVTIRRKVVADAGYFDQSLRSCEDLDLWLRISPTKTFIGSEEVLVRYRVHEQSLSANVTGMHTAKKAVIEKHFGPDDGQVAAWPPEKKLAYAGLYRYFLVTAIQRRGEWQAGSEHLRKAFVIDPAQTLDVDLFYELALGTQPAGYRGCIERISLAANAEAVIQLLDDLFNHDNDALQALKANAYGTACYAIGLCAYNTHNLALARRYLWQAGIHRPRLWTGSKLAGLWLKTLLGKRLLNRLRRPQTP